MQRGRRSRPCTRRRVGGRGTGRDGTHGARQASSCCRQPPLLAVHLEHLLRTHTRIDGSVGGCKHGGCKHGGMRFPCACAATRVARQQSRHGRRRAGVRHAAGRRNAMSSVCCSGCACAWFTMAPQVGRNPACHACCASLPCTLCLPDTQWPPGLACRARSPCLSEPSAARLWPDLGQPRTPCCKRRQEGHAAASGKDHAASGADGRRGTRKPACMPGRSMPPCDAVRHRRSAAATCAVPHAHSHPMLPPGAPGNVFVLDRRAQLVGDFQQLHRKKAWLAAAQIEPRADLKRRRRLAGRPAHAGSTFARTLA